MPPQDSFRSVLDRGPDPLSAFDQPSGSLGQVIQGVGMPQNSAPMPPTADVIPGLRQSSQNPMEIIQALSAFKERQGLNGPSPLNQAPQVQPPSPGLTAQMPSGGLSPASLSTGPSGPPQPGLTGGGGTAQQPRTMAPQAAMPAPPPLPGLQNPMTPKQVFGPSQGRPMTGNGMGVDLPRMVQGLVHHSAQKKFDAGKEQATTIFLGDLIQARIAANPNEKLTPAEANIMAQAKSMEGKAEQIRKDAVTNPQSAAYSGFAAAQQQEQQRLAQAAAQQDQYAKMLEVLKRGNKESSAVDVNESVSSLYHSTDQSQIQKNLADAERLRAEAANYPAKLKAETDAKWTTAVSNARKEQIKLTKDPKTGEEVRTPYKYDELTPKEQEAIKTQESVIKRNLAIAQKDKALKTGMTPYQQATVDLRKHQQQFAQNMAERKQNWAEAHPKTPNMPASIADRMSKASLVETYIKRMQEIVKNNPDEFGVTGSISNRFKGMIAKQNPEIVEFQDLADRAGITVTGMHLRSAPLSLQEMNKLRSLWINPEALNRRLDAAYNAAHGISTGTNWPEGLPRPATVPPRGTNPSPTTPRSGGPLSPDDIAKRLGTTVIKK